MKKISLAAVIAMLTTPVMAAIPGVNDYVTAVKVGSGYPNCIQVQTANGGGDVAKHTWLSCGGSTICFGIGTGGKAYALGEAVAATAASAVLNSRWAGSSSGPYIQFTDHVAPWFGDCPPTYDGLDQLSQ